ncbi:Protein abnormal spindle [Camponotus floridanus]|uniref:Protein abnormal spindle n=2 Tax=Camponotus floridanus TaxID=104421 RepID=E2AFJ2_CAMFO|nr:Protein abnormal spindle [Camponotus floridanus]
MSPSYSASQSKPSMEPHYVMLLAPFQPATRIELETNVNTSAECYLDIKNAGDKTLNVTVTKVPAAERRITLSLSELEVQGKSNGTICIKWSPKEAGSWRDVLQFTDNRRIKYDIVIATTARDNKKSYKTKKKLPKSSLSLMKTSNISISTTSRQFYQNNILKIPTISQPLIPNLDTQTKEYKLRHLNDVNKENIFNKCGQSETSYAIRENENKINEIYNHDEPDNIMFEQNMNIWGDGSILPQVFSTNEPQDIRRVTYVKEKRSSNILYEHNGIIKKTTVKNTCDNDNVHSEISVLLNKFTFTPADIISSSPEAVKEELAESTSFSQNSNKHRTFNISQNHLFETSTTHDTKTLKVSSQSACLHNLSPIKSSGCSLMTDIKDLIASSPIAQHYVPKDSNEFLEHNRKIKIESNVQMSPITQHVPKDSSECLKHKIEPSIQIINREYFTFEIIPKNDVAKEIGDMYIEISPPKKHSKISQYHNISVPKLSGTRTGRITKNKTLCEGNTKKLQLNIPVAKRNTKNVAVIKVNKQSLIGLNKTKWHTSSFIRESSYRMQNEESFIYETFELDPFAPSTTEDPFLKNIVHYDEEWLLQQELAFTKWLNTLLSSPEDLSVDIETVVTDIGKVWQSCKAQKTTVLAETKEAVSARYHTSTRLNTLRKAASAMFNNNEITQVLSRINMYIVKGALCVRSDRNLHRDIGLQKLILALFLNYNPLWLRIGLETVYNESIPLRSNNDIIGMTRFLLTRFFSDPQLIKMPGYHKTDPSLKIVTKLNQFILKKFLYLIYFLDYAKQHKLIGHDPCLFHKRAQHKESREILLSFSRELLSGIGDVTKVLRSHNYILTHRQTYIEEYNYAVTDIRRDLRDGVRLCRIMELITGVRKLTQRCRVPAISRLQKVYNVDMALNALSQAGYILEGDIDAKSIADGHCEKTLSLLWQIIHKYQAPRFDRAARTVQRWWRAKLWYICVRNFLRARRNLAAIVIQRAWRCKMTPSSRETICDLEERKWYLQVRRATICLQKWWRLVRETRKEKLQELKNRREAAIRLQRRWRVVLLMRTQRDQYLNLRNAALMIQTRWRAIQAMKLQRSNYLAYRDATVKIQYFWRSVKLARKQREWFLHRRESARIIQIWWRRCLLARKARNDFLQTKTAVRDIERWWISVLDRKKFLLHRANAILIQRTWRKYQIRRQEVACLKIQTWWKMTMYSRKYKLQKSCCIKLQRWWRGINLTRHQRIQFLQLRKAALIVQKNRRAKVARRHYLKQRRAVLVIQSWYRCINSAKLIRQHYLKMRNSAIQIENWWRNVTVARQERKRYLQLRKATILLQIHWRRRVLVRTDRQRYLTKKKSCVTLQSWWRMIKERSKYKRYKMCVLKIQRRWRAMRVARGVKKEYLLTRAAIILQARWRGLATRRWFITSRRAAIVIQSYYRMKIEERKYKTIKYATLIIQTYWRAYIIGKHQRLRYLSLRRTAIMLQRRYRQRKIENEEFYRQRQEDFAMKIRNECEEAMQDIQNVPTGLAIPDSDYWKETINNLRNCNNVGTLVVSLALLDAITKLSPTVCIILCELNLTDDIYNAIAQNNRSLPWMMVCLRACSILITLTKHDYTRKYTIKSKYALALVKLLNGSLKNKEVFLHCATLIWLLSQNEDYLKAMMTCPQIKWWLKNIQQKVLKDDIMTKFQKSKDIEKLYPSCESRDNTQERRLFTNMSFAVAAIVKRI